MQKVGLGVVMAVAVFFNVALAFMPATIVRTQGVVD